MIFSYAWKKESPSLIPKGLFMQSDSKHYYTVIRPHAPLLQLDLKELFKYKDLILILAKKDFSQRYRQTILGPIWALLSPLLTSLTHLFIFGTIANIGTDNIPKILFYLCSNNLWSVFSTCLRDNSHTFLSNSNLFSKVYFPRLSVPAASTLVILYRWGIQTLVLIPLYLYYLIKGAVHPIWSMFFLLPLILLWTALIGTGAGLIINSATTKYRDLAMLVGFGLSLGIYVTPVVYPLSTLTESKWFPLICLNPVSAPVELFRKILLGTGTIIPWSVACSLLMTFCLVFLGLIAFHHVERNFVDTI